MWKITKASSMQDANAIELTIIELLYDVTQRLASLSIGILLLITENLVDSSLPYGKKATLDCFNGKFYFNEIIVDQNVSQVKTLNDINKSPNIVIANKCLYTHLHI